MPSYLLCCCIVDNFTNIFRNILRNVVGFLITINICQVCLSSTQIYFIFTLLTSLCSCRIFAYTYSILCSWIIFAVCSSLNEDSCELFSVSCTDTLISFWIKGDLVGMHFSFFLKYPQISDNITLYYFLIFFNLWYLWCLVLLILSLCIGNLQICLWVSIFNWTVNHFTNSRFIFVCLWAWCYNIAQNILKYIVFLFNFLIA